MKTEHMGLDELILIGWFLIMMYWFAWYGLGIFKRERTPLKLRKKSTRFRDVVIE